MPIHAGKNFAFRVSLRMPERQLRSVVNGSAIGAGVRRFDLALDGGYRTHGW